MVSKLGWRRIGVGGVLEGIGDFGDGDGKEMEK